MTLTFNARWSAYGAAAAALISLAAAHPAAAAPAAGTLVIGSVDISRLQTNSTRKAKYDTELHALEDRLGTALQEQAKAVMLSPTDQATLGTLLNTPHPSDADRAQVTALETKSEQASQRLIALQQEKSPTPADTAELGRLTDLSNNGQTTLKGVADGYQAQLKKLSDTDNAAFTQAVKDAIAGAARERGLTVVFTSDIAVYTTNDITDDVIKRINK